MSRQRTFTVAALQAMMERIGFGGFPLNINIRDASTIQKLRPLEVTSYLQSTDWQQKAAVSKMSVWVRRIGDEEFEVTVPLDETLGDYALRMGDVLRTLAVVEDRSESQIYTDLLTTFADAMHSDTHERKYDTLADKAHTQITHDRAALLSALASAISVRLVGEVIARVRALPENCRHSGNLAFADVWEEFKAQVQGEESILIRFYGETIEGFCADAVNTLSPELQQFLWLWTEGYERLWVNQDMVQLADFAPQDVADDLYRRVCDAAGNEPMPESYHEPSDDYPEGG